MAYSQVPTRSSADTNASADVNQLQDNIDAMLGSEASSGPTRTMPALIGSGSNLVDGNAVKATADKTIEDAGYSDASVKNNRLKQYLIGSTYNSVTISLTTSGTGLSVVRGTLVPYVTIGGEYRLRCNLRADHDSYTSITLTLTSATFKNVSDWLQIGLNVGDGGQYGYTYSVQDTNTFAVVASSASVKISLAFDWELKSWPSWADALA